MDSATLKEFTRVEGQVTKFTILLPRCKENDEGWTAEIKELPGLIGKGKSKRKAIKRVIKSARKHLRDLLCLAKEQIYEAEHIG